MTRELPEDQHNWASKLVITGTGFFGNSRKLLRQSVQETGAQYSGDLLCGCTTHLVCKSLDAARSGTKGAQQCSGFGGGGAQQEAHLEDLVIPDSQPASEYTPHSWTQHQHGLLRYQQHAAASLPSICNARSQGSAAYISNFERISRAEHQGEEEVCNGENSWPQKEQSAI
ncbi:hypothetical protein WJX72_010474 [[Myrmecia] bisecta]|uniref:BRCT domain-containing protein n=1 Tax=[Myrmecia] bisecta TaxID=41462 RepID=A0AAW1Q4H7_9CHLO